jgi:hypothetical protein
VNSILDLSRMFHYKRNLYCCGGISFFSLRGLSIIRAYISGEGTIFQNTIINHAKDAGKCICIYTTFSTEIILQDHQQYSKDVICHNIGNAKDPVLN